MPSFLPDTSCIVAAVCSWHEHHIRAVPELERRLSQDEEMTVAAHSLAEAYAVLTRLPPPHRLSPKDAFNLLDENFINATKIIALDGKSYRNLLRNAATEGTVGGRTYDAIIATCAIQAKVKTILTFNEKHFSAFADKGLQIVIPS